jgi:plastocyanin
MRVCVRFLDRAVLAGWLVVSLGCGAQSSDVSKPANASPPSSATAGGPAKVNGKVSGSGPGAIVVLTPADGRVLPPPATPKVMDQAGYEFLPALLVAQTGQPVQFRNSEDVLHNVRVTEVATETPVFNVATLAFGAYNHTFDRPGFYTVTCDIHSSMRADILIAPSPYTAKTDDSGAFGIDNVPAGNYTATLYAGGAPTTKAVVVKPGRTDLELP